MRTKIDIAEIEFAEGSQISDFLKNKNSYHFMKKTIENLLARQNVETDRLSFTGSMEDMICYLSGLVEIYMIQSEGDEFTPVK